MVNLANARPGDAKIVFTGPMGAGKTTAIRAISDAPPVATEVANTEQTRVAKETTTVAMDYGQMILEDGTAVGLYGTPGQERFSFMWEILAQGALGTILLVDATTATALDDVKMYARAFQGFNPAQPLVIGVGRVAPNSGLQVDQCTQALAASSVVAPVFSVDVRNKEDVLFLIQTLLCMVEVQGLESADVRN